MAPLKSSLSGSDKLIADRARNSTDNLLNICLCLLETLTQMEPQALTIWFGQLVFCSVGTVYWQSLGLKCALTPTQPVYSSICYIVSIDWRVVPDTQTLPLRIETAGKQRKVLGSVKVDGVWCFSTAPLRLFGNACKILHCVASS